MKNTSQPENQVTIPKIKVDPQTSLAIVVAQYHRPITQELLAGAQRVLAQNHVSQVDVLWVPGAFEIPFLCQTLAATKKYQALIALGAVIRGDTDHYDYVCSAVTNGVAQVSLKYDLPVIFGLLTTNTLEQARDRIGGKAGHKGEEAAMAAIEMISLLKSNHLGSFRPHSGHTLQHQNHDVLNNQ